MNTWLCVSVHLCARVMCVYVRLHCDSCGTGLCAVALKGRFDTIVGMDLSPEMAAKALEKAAQSPIA